MNNNTFLSARIKLTAWYLLIIMLISIFFTSVIYTGINNELARIDRQQQLRKQRLDRMLPLLYPGQPAPSIELQDISESRRNVILTLITINIAILLAAGAAGYFLAGKTLKPIKSMLDDQNRFIADASHELRTPLTALRSEIEVNLRDKNLSLEDTKQLLQSNLEETMHLQLLSDKLIKLTSTNKFTQTQFSKLNIKNIISEASKKVYPMAKKKHISIQENIQDAYIDGDQSTLVELFIIIIDNAIKYSAENTIVTINQSKTNNFLNLNISDTGIGIAKKDIRHIFDRFYRVDKSRTKTEVSGFGLGLSIAKRIAEAHNGAIHVTSELKKGTTFRVQLPLKK